MGDSPDGVVDRFQVHVRGMVFDARAAGPPGAREVLLLHGFPQTSASWQHQVEALGASGMRALAFDQRGYSPGARLPQVSDYRLGGLVDDALAVADAQGMDRFDLVGHDWGAMVAWVLAARHPDRVRSLTAVSVPHPSAFAGVLSSGDADQSSRSSYIGVFRQPGNVAERLLLGEDGSGDGLRAMFHRSGMPPEAPEIAEFVAAMRQPGALTAALNWYRAMDAHEVSDVGLVEVPTMYVWSSEDIAIGRRAAEDCARFVKGPYRFEVLEGVSHWIPETASDALNALLLDHLATLGD